MAEPKGLWEKLGDQLVDPLDWVAAGVGAIVGGAVSVATHFADAGTTAAGGAIALVTARKAIGRAFQRRRLRKRARGLDAEIVEIGKKVQTTPGQPAPADFRTLVADLQLETGLWERHVTSDAQYAGRLDALVKQLRMAFVKHQKGGAH